MNDLKIAKRNLSDALGDNIKLYWANMKLWYRQKITKEEFDLEARRLLSDDNIHLHNEFLVTVLTRCQILSSESSAEASKVKSSSLSSSTEKLTKKSKPPKKKKVLVRPTFENRFVPSDAMLKAPAVAMQVEESLDFCARSLFLPDPAMLHGRVFVTAWEWGIDNVSGATIPLIMHSVQHVLKNVISAVISRRSGYSVREGKFKHNMGVFMQLPSLRNQSRDRPHLEKSSSTNMETPSGQYSVTRPDSETSEQCAVMQQATSGIPPTQKPVSTYDLLDALQVHPGVLASHTVSCAAVERTIVRLWHPDRDELHQDDIQRQRVAQQQEELMVL
ncbi:transcriptional adapter 1-like isoform X2 [Acanthaster planci]|uniref:Transcriptional adapter 1-like isoform X2 n=1 Tax=Acanthaster planci TaxID=133434 RepID=A0A8B7Y7C2_ACAPL|nr:transcriptional adapter 1-like isoform X2 [Acanthaster planci]